jgi:hypothetical protein
MPDALAELRKYMFYGILSLVVVLTILSWGLHWVNISWHFKQAWDAISHLRLTTAK